MATIDERYRESDDQQQPPVTSRAHPRIYTIVIGLTIWFICGVWIFSGGGGVTNYLLFVVTGFLCIAIGLPLILFRVARARPAMQGRSPEGVEQPSLRDWMRWRYDTWTERLSGASAAAQILLPIAAAAVGMTAIGIAYRLAGG